MSNSAPITGDPFAVAMEADGLKKESFRGSVVTVLSQGTRLAIQIGSQVILGRLLFPSDFGLLAMIYPITGFIQIFNNVGLGQAIIQRPVIIQAQVSALFWVNIALSCGLAGVVVLVAPLAAIAYREPHVIGPMIVLGLIIPLSALGINPTALLLRHMRFVILARNEVIALIVGVTVTIICAMRGLSYWSIIAGQFANTLTGNALNWFACRWYPSAPKAFGSVWGDIKFGGNLTAVNLATFAITSGDNAIVGLMAGRVALGLYDRSYGLVVQPLGQIMAPVSRVAVPLLSRFQDVADEYRAMYMIILQTICLLTIPAMLVCISNGADIILLFLGNHWIKAGPIFSWISVGGLAGGIYSSANWIFISQSRTRELRHFTIAAAAINILTFIIGAFWGIVGIAAAGALGFVFLTTPLMLFGATRFGHIRFRDLVTATSRFVAQGGVAYTLIVFVGPMLPFHGVMKIGVVTLISYGVVLGFSVLIPSQRALLKGGFRAFKDLQFKKV